jgi:hypothetical protein
VRRPRAAAETDRAGRLEILLRSRRPDDFERKFKDPNGIIFDVNWKVWTMTSGKIKTKPSETRSAAARAKGTRQAGSRKAGRRKAPAGKAKSNRTKQRRSVIGAGMKRR